MENARSAGEGLALELAVCLLLAKTDWNLDRLDQAAHGAVASCMRALPPQMPDDGPEAAAEFMIAVRQKLIDLGRMAAVMRSIQQEPGETQG